MVVNGKTSERRDVTAGVPEGALLAPILFALYINDLPMTVNSAHCVMFADDVKVDWTPQCTDEFGQCLTVSSCSLTSTISADGRQTGGCSSILQSAMP